MYFMTSRMLLVVKSCTAYYFLLYAIDRAYVDKDELKQIRKENKIKTSYANIRQFEREHMIPEMEPAEQKKLDERWKVDSDD